MEDQSPLALWAVLWLAAAGLMLLVVARRRTGSVGLVPAYLINLWLIHWPGAAIYLLPWYGIRDRPLVEAGFQQSLVAVVAFGLGAALLAPLLAGAAPADTPRSSAAPERRLIKVYLGVGLVCYFLLQPLLGRVPTISALVSTGWGLVVVGLGLGCRQAWLDGRRRDCLLWLLATLGLPLLTVITQGFIGYGSAAALAALLLVGSIYRPRWHLIAAAPIICYLVFSLYVTYMRDRPLLRASVWGGQSYGERVDAVQQSLGGFDLLDLTNQSHLWLIDDRLNQNYLVGAAVRYLDWDHLAQFANGETLWQALIALVPRAIWLDKPVQAGSMTLVADHTGILFDVHTSIGVGHVMEFYINYGTPGVAVGALVLGLVTALVDRGAAGRLARGDWRGFALWFVPGLSLLNVGGSLVELTSSSGAALLTVLIVHRFVAGEAPPLRAQRVRIQLRTARGSISTRPARPL